MMSDLKVANIQKCLSILREFYDAVPVSGNGNGLEDKKKQAGIALEHLGKLFQGELAEVELGMEQCSNCKINVESM